MNPLLLILILLMPFTAQAADSAAGTVTVQLPEYTDALKNPLMGISPKNYHDDGMVFGSPMAERGLQALGNALPHLHPLVLAGE